MKLNEIKKAKSVADLGIKYTGGSFNCSYMKLTSLEGSPQKIDGNFYCNSNKLTSLQGAPQEVSGDFACAYNQFTSLEGAPPKVGRGFFCQGNKLTSLEGAPPEIGGNFYCGSNRLLTSLKNIHKIVKKIGGTFSATQCPIQSHVLGLLLIKELKIVNLDNEKVAAIINAHLDGGSMKSALDCQHALIKAGFPEYAKL